MTLYDLLSSGIKTWLVYDGFYSIDFEDREYFEKMVIDQVKFNFYDFIEHNDFIYRNEKD